MNNCTTDQFKSMSRIPTCAKMAIAAGPAIFVEGTSDVRLFSRLVKNIRIYSANGKDGVVRESKTLNDNEKRLFRGIIDRDYDFFIDNVERLTDPWFIYTDAHSLETLLWQIDTDKSMLMNIVSELISYDKTADCSKLIEVIYERVYETAYFKGILRIVNMLYEWGIDCRIRLNDSLFDPNDHLDQTAFIQLWVKGRPLFTIKNGIKKMNNLRDPTFYLKVEEEVEYVKKEVLKEKHTKWEVMQGHDLSEAYTYFIDKFFGEYIESLDYQRARCKNHLVEFFELRTYMVASVEKLKQTEVYKKILLWKHDLQLRPDT